MEISEDSTNQQRRPRIVRFVAAFAIVLAAMLAATPLAVAVAQSSPVADTSSPDIDELAAVPVSEASPTALAVTGRSSGATALAALVLIAGGMMMISFTQRENPQALAVNSSRLRCSQPDNY